MQIDSDEEARQAEEEEVRQLQAQQVEGLDDDDYGLPGFAAEPSLEDQVAAGGGSRAAAAAEVETVDIDVEGLTEGERLTHLAAGMQPALGGGPPLGGSRG
jgi:hypothetical protein